MLLFILTSFSFIMKSRVSQIEVQFKENQWKYAYKIAIGLILGSLLYGILASHWRFCGSKNEHDCTHTESVEIQFDIQFRKYVYRLVWKMEVWYSSNHIKLSFSLRSVKSKTISSFFQNHRPPIYSLYWLSRITLLLHAIVVKEVFRLLENSFLNHNIEKSNFRILMKCKFNFIQNNSIDNS